MTDEQVKKQEAEKARETKANQAQESAKETLDDFMSDNDSLDGFESITNETVAIPFIKLTQELSKQLDEDSEKYIADCKIGDYVIDADKVVLGSSFNAVVLRFEHVFLEWSERERGKLFGVHTPENAQKIAIDNTFGKMKTENDHDLIDTYIYYVVVEGQEDKGVLILSMSSSNIKKAKELNRAMINQTLPDGRKALPYYLVFRFSTVKKKNDRGKWFGVDFEFVRFINKKEYALIKDERSSLTNNTKQIDYQNVIDDTSGQGNGSSDKDLPF